MVKEVSALDVARALGRGEDLLIIDVREGVELRFARLEGALHIPLGRLDDEAADLDPARRTVVMCHHGVRSLHGAAILSALGFEDVASMAGGIEAWARLVDPTVGRY